ncbi:MAG TPA: Holliday junction resolvase RuvX, partial [Armatimonadota bacterium]|nr:Holliday junction resolvase RuvX [Armatimonadota bacterium]
MARVMALDVGEKTIGVALSDETGTIASPLTTIRRTESIKADL